MQSPEMMHLHAALFWALMIGMTCYFYLKRYDAAKLSKYTSRYIDDRRYDLNHLVLQTETFLNNTSSSTTHLTLDGDDEKSSKLRMLLSRFEILAEDVKLGLVSETHIRDSYSSTIMNMMDFAKKYVYLYRINNHRYSAFENLEHLYIRFKYRKDSIIQNFIEWMINKKMYIISALIFKSKYYFISELFSLNTNYMKEESKNIGRIIRLTDTSIHFMMYSLLILYMWSK